MNLPPLLKVLLIDDDNDDFVLIREQLSHSSLTRFAVDWEPDSSKAKDKMLAQLYDIYLVDYRLGSLSGLDLIGEAAQAGCKAPMILLTGYGDESIDLKAMKAGAADYLSKNELTSSLLERSLRYAIYRFELSQELREREEKFRGLLDSAFEAILVHEEDGKILEVNRAAAELFGVAAEELVGANLLDLCGEDCRQHLRAMAKQKVSPPSETSVRRRDGQEIDVEVAGKSYHHHLGAARLTAMRDITERKQMLAQILVQERLASVGLLASGLAHEIGTPLGVIRGRAEYISMQAASLPSIQKSAGVIVAQIDRVSKLIWSLLNLARGQKGSQAKTVDLAEVVGEVLELMDYELRKNKIEVKNELPRGIDISVVAEAEPLHQVILNLLVNSVHAIEEAQVQGRTQNHYLALSVRQEGQKWILSVTDSGCGISQGNMQKLFGPFFTTKDTGKGTGLGLATSYRIVESWKGKIDVISQLGQGTTFTVSLPSASGSAKNPSMDPKILNENSDL